jgi:hypothetical protein
MSHPRLHRVAAVLALPLLLAACSSSGTDAIAPDAGGAVGAPVEAPAQPALDDPGALVPAAGGSAAGGGTAGVANEGGDTDGSLGGADSVAQRSVVRRAELVVELADPRSQAATVRRIAIASGGYVEQESIHGGPTPPPVPASGPATAGGSAAQAPGTAFLVLRVPVEALDDVTDRVADLGEVTLRAGSAEDVTEQLVDLESRVATQRASIERLEALLGEAARLRDVLAIEAQLTARQAELESLLARQEAVTGQADLATLSVTLTTPATVVEEGSGFVAGLAAGWDAFQRTLVLALTGLGAALPFLAVIVVVAIPLAVIVRRWRRRSAVEAEVDAIDDAGEDVRVG